MNQRYDVLGFGLLFLGIAIFGIPFISEAASQSVYSAFKEFQTSIIGVAALAFAYWAGRPVYEQLKEMRVQSAVATRETIRRELLQIRHEIMLCDDINLQAAYADQEDLFNDQRSFSAKAFYQSWDALIERRMKTLESKAQELRLSSVAAPLGADIESLRASVDREIIQVSREWNAFRLSLTSQSEFTERDVDATKFTYCEITSAPKLQSECMALKAALEIRQDRLAAVLARADASI